MTNTANDKERQGVLSGEALEEHYSQVNLHMRWTATYVNTYVHA